MFNMLPRLIPLCISLFVLCAFSPPPATGYIIKNIHIIPMTGEAVLKNHSVLIEDGRIKKIFPTQKIEKTKAKIDKGFLHEVCAASKLVSCYFFLVLFGD